MPECVAVETLRNGGWEPSRRRLFLTFVAAMDRARDADRLWRVATRMALEHPWTFAPAEIRARAAEIGDRLRNYGVSQRHTDDCTAWQRIGESLSSRDTAPTVYDAIYLGKGDARELRRDVGRVRNGLPLFPFLRGPKIGPRWVRMLAAPGDADIQAIEALPVAVDVQVRKITEYLGVLQSRSRELDEVRGSIQQAWRQDVQQHGPPAIAGTCAALDPALWFYAKWGCTFCERAARQLPISDICAECRLGAT
jgi:hypothetical protein